uniref:Uncharacterized protein n=1 Tax=Meloidogyne enterolobii TaxID=390850 RepID=A0A6V7VVR8_MELEN|nr:unnamed protein product [Meloidogyne enterolobii]
MDRLNLFDSINRKNYFIIEEDGNLVIKPERNVWNKGDPPIKLSTRPLTIYQLLNIAYYQVIRGRTSNDAIPFKCRHFVYEFITAIAAKENGNDLLTFDNWPENIRFIDNKISGNDPNNTAFIKSFQYFEQYRNFDYDNDFFKNRIAFIPPNN